MSLRLILIRHAKSSWGDPFADDHARVLNNRGRTSAKAIGEWLAQAGHVPDLVLCSDAARTRETAERIILAFAARPRLQFSGRLYHAAPDTIFDLIRKQTTSHLAVIGHNPGIGMAANALVATPPDHHRFSDYPTCATTVIDFAMTSWGDLKPGWGQVVDFTVPRDLIGTSGSEID